MSIFSRKSKKAKEQKAKAAAQTDDAVNSAKPAPYRHVPRHAASDSVGSTPAIGDRAAEQQRVLAASLRRMSSNTSRFSTKENMLHHGTMSASASPYATPRSTPPASVVNLPAISKRYTIGGTGYKMGLESRTIFTTDPSAPPVPPTSNFLRHSDNGRNLPSTATEPHSILRASGSTTNIQDYAKSYDSGYGSAAGTGSAQHSRAPSEVGANNGSTIRLPRNDIGFLPSVSLGEELATEPVFASRGGLDDVTETPATRQRSGSSVSDYVSKLDPGSRIKSEDAQQESPNVKKTRTGSVKQTRFQEPIKSASRTPQVQEIPIVERGGLPVQANAETDQNIAAPPAGPAAPMGTPAELTEPQPQYAARNRTSTPPPASHLELERLRANPARHSTPMPLPAPLAPSFPDLERVSSNGTHRSAPPPLSILEGFKVNKKGRVLNEEGELIGELVEGDLIDCVRQKVNAFGEVIDEYGGVVGHVSTLLREVFSPALCASSPASTLRETYQQHVSPRRQSSYPPEQQRDEPYQRPTSPEPDSHIVQQDYFQRISRPRQAMSSLDLDSANVTRVELDASEQSEAAPVLDHSDIFLPPFAPPRSPLREFPHVTRQRSEEANEPEYQQRSEVHSPEPESEQDRGSWASRNLEADEEELRPASPTIPLQTTQQEPQSVPDVRPDQQAREVAVVPAPQSILRNSSPTLLPQSSSFPNMFLQRRDGPIDEVEEQQQQQTRIPPSSSVQRHRSMDESASPLQPRKAAPLPSFPRHAFTTPSPPTAGGLTPGTNPYLQASRRSNLVATTATIPRPILTQKNSLHAPVRKSPLSSHESSPADSESGGSDDGKPTSQPPPSTLPRLPTNRSYAYSSASVRTTGTTMSAATSDGGAPKSRRYFTHQGRVTVAPGQPTPSQTASATRAADAGVKADDALSMKSGKSRKRFSLFGGGKKGQAVAAH